MRCMSAIASVISAKSAGDSAGDPRKRQILQHQDISRSATSRLLAQLIPIPGGLADIHSLTYVAKPSA